MGTEERRLHRGRVPLFLFCQYTHSSTSGVKEIRPKVNACLPKCFNPLFPEVLRLFVEILRSPPSVTWLGFDAGNQDALDKMSHLMRCQTKRDLLDNGAQVYRRHTKTTQV